MPNYNCYMCDYSTSIKTHFFKHLKTEKHKKTKELYEDELELCINVPSKNLKKPHFSPQESLKNPQKSSKNLKNPQKSPKNLKIPEKSSKYLKKAQNT